MSGDTMISIRKLPETDVSIFRTVRLHALQESPTAFGSSYEEEERMTVAEIRARIGSTPDRWVLGAFVQEELTSVIGVYREGRPKTRHKAHIWGMYVMPDFRGKGIGRLL